MRLKGRHQKAVFFTVFGACLVALAVTLNIGWIVLNWRQVALMILGVIFFLAIIIGLVLNTAFLVREIRRNEQQDSFINAMTHELKTPIASIRLYLETLKMREVDEAKRREFYGAMLADSERLLATIDQVLHAGRASHRRGHSSPELLDLAQTVSECVELARARYDLDQRSLDFAEIRENGAPALVLGDPEELRTAVSNLLDNAVKYSDKEVQIAVRVAPAASKRVAVRITDQGIGIPREQLRRVFNRFYRVPGHGMMRFKGTGLGLFIVRTIVREHGGRIFAESEGEGRGSSFTIQLPRA